MSKITCALSASQIEGLFKVTYKSMTNALEAGEAFNADLFMSGLFQKIAAKKDIATAVLFVQQVPSMVYTGAGLSKLLKLKLVAGKDLRELMSEYKDPENGFNVVLKTFAPDATPEQVLEAVAIHDSLIGKTRLEGTSNPPSGTEAVERMKPFTTFTSTFIEFIKLNPNDMGILTKEKIDPNKMRIYNTLNAIKDSIPEVMTPFTEVNYKGQVIKIKAIQLTKLKQSMLDETTVAEIIKSKSIGKVTSEVNYKGEMVVQADERVALVLTNDNGDFLYFTEEGELSSEAEGGKIVYQFSRNVRDDIKNPGMLRVTDIYGERDQIMTPKELLAAEAKSMGLSEDKYKEELKIAGSSYEKRKAEIQAQQQKEFRALKAFNESITKEGKSAKLPLTGVSVGIPANLVVQGPSIGQLQQAELINKENFKSIKLIKEPRDGFEKGTAVMKINGEEFALDRPSMTVDIARKVAHMLTNPNISVKDKLLYMSYFMDNQISDKVKRYKIYHNNTTKEFTFKIRPFSDYEALQNNDKNIPVDIELVPANTETIFKALMKGYTLYGQDKATKMLYNEQAIKDDLFYDYNPETGTFNTEQSSYLNLIQTFNDVEVKLVENKDPGFFNSYMHFNVDSKFEQEAQEAVNNAKSNPTIAEKKAAIVEVLKQGVVPKGTVSKPANTAGYQTETQWVFTDKAGSTVNFYNHESNLTQADLTAEARLVLMQPFTGNNGVLYPEPVAVYIGDKFVGFVQENKYSLGDAAQDAEATGEIEEAEEKDIVVSSLNFGAVEDAVETSDEQMLNPKDVEQPSDDDIPDWGFNRSAELPNGVTQEQIDAAKAWWESSPLSKFISIEHMTNIVNSNVFARFIAAGKTLATPENLGKIQINEATKGNYVDVYHEAWHVFSQLFLTKNQKLELYNEVRNSNPKWKNLSFLEIEELIAEDFRSYALDPKPADAMPKRNTLFRRILNFLKKLFGKRPNINNTSEVAGVKDLFEKLYFSNKKPDLLKNYKPLTDNVMWDILNRGPQAVNDKSAEFISSQDGKLMTASIDSIFSKLIDDSAAKYGFKSASMAILSDTFKTKDGITNREAAYEYAKKKLINKLNQFTEEAIAIGLPTTIALQNRLELLNDNIRVLTATIDNWGNDNTGMIKYHTETSTFAILKQKAKVYEEEVDDDAKEGPRDSDQSSPEDAKNTERFGDKSVGDKSLAEMASTDTLFLLKSLFRVDSKGNKVQNRFGFDELADFPSVWNNVVRAIGGEKDPAVMQQKLAQAALTFPELKQLIDFKLPDLGKPKNTLDMSITTAFWQDFRKTRVTYIQLFMAEQEDGTYVAEVMEASNETTSVIYQFRNKFKAATANDYITKTPKNTSLLKLDSIVKDFGVKGTFTSSKSWEFARAVGIALDDLTIIKRTLEEKPEYFGLEYIYSVVKKFAQIEKDPKASAEAKRYLKLFKEDPVDVLTNPIPEGIINEKVVNEKNLIVKLAELQGRYGKDASNFSVLNAERNLVFEHIEDFSASLQVNAINDVDNMSKLWTTNKYQFMSYLDPSKNPFTRRSKVLDSLFKVSSSEDQYDRRNNRQLTLNAVSGTQLNDKATGANTTSLDKQGKFIQEMHMLLKGGLQEFMRHASKSSSFGVHVEGGLVIGRGKGDDSHLYVDIDKFANGNEAELFAIENIFTGYVASELERIIKFKANIDEYKNFVGYNRVIKDSKGKEIGLAGEFFTAFDNVLREDTKKLLLENTDKMDTRNVNFLHSFLSANPDIKLKVTQDITDYFNDQTTLNNDFLNKKPYVEQALMNRLDVFNLEKEDAQKLLVKAYTYNSWIHNFEMANLFYGDLTLFDHTKDEGHKRIPGATSGGNGFRTDIGAQNYINDVLNQSTVDPKTGAVTFTTYADVLNNKQKLDGRYKNINYTGTFNTAIIQDVIRVSKYSGVIERALTNDYRARFKNATKIALLDQFSKHSRKQFENLSVAQLKEKLIEKRIKTEMKAYNKMEEGDGQGYVTMDAYRALKVLEGKWLPEQQTLYEKIIAGETINPQDVIKFLPPYKVQNFGPLANAPMTITAMHKFSLVPLIPTMIKDSDLESLHEQMMAADIQYVTFQTGSKVGSITSNGTADKIYNDSEQKSIIKPDPSGKNGIQFTKNTIYLEYLKNVTNIPEKRKKQTIFSTQLRKLILEGLYSRGQVVSPKFKPFVEAYENAVKDYSRILRLQILNEIGYEKKKNGKYEGKLDKFLELVQKELDRKEVPEHLIEYIGVTPQGNVINDLSFHLEADEIEKILVSLINKRLVKQKVKGEALVQVASSMTNGMWDGSANLTKATDDEIRKFIGTNNLPFYNQTDDGIIDFNKLYKNLSKDRLKEILKGKEATLEDQARYWTPTYQSNLRAEISYLKDVIAGKKPSITEVSLPTSAMKVAVAMQGDFTNIFKAKDLDGNTIGIYGTKTVKNKKGEDVEVEELMFDESLKKLNELVKNEEWLNRDNNRKLVTMTAVRIPVQGLNSMEFMEVFHFLPPEAGNIIIPPSELVAKSGADYDIDKLTTFMPNIDSDGKYAESLMTIEAVERLVTEQTEDATQAARIIETQKAAIENRLIQSTKDILSLPENFANLVRPNDTYLLKEIADELEPDVTEFDKYATMHSEGYRYSGDKKVISPTRMLEVGFNIHKQEVNMGGKDGLGIVALKNALHPIFVALGAKMPKTYKSSVFNKEFERYEDGLEDYDMRLLMRHNTIDGNISLSDMYDVDNIDRVSDIFNHKMNGLVDVEKDSWIFNIQGNVEVIPTLSYLIMAGVPRQLAVKFVSQPLVREYVERQRVLNSPYSKVTKDVPEFSAKSQAISDVAPSLSPSTMDKANKNKLIDTLKFLGVDQFVLTTKADSEKNIKSTTTQMSKDTIIKALQNPNFNFASIAKVVVPGEKKNYAMPLDKTPFSTTNYYYTAKAASEDAGVTDFTLDQLENLIENDDTESPLAIAAFAHFIEIEKQIGGLEALQRVANPDTKSFKTIEEIIQREYNLSLVSQMSKLDPGLVRALQKESILSEFYDNELVKQLLQPLFILRNNKKVSNFITVALDKYRDSITAKYGTGEDSTRRFINEYKNAIVNYAYQNYMTNSIDETGNVVDVPNMYNDLEVVMGKNIPFGAKIEGDKLIVDVDTLNADYNEKRYQSNSDSKDSYTNRGLAPFKAAKDLFQSKSSFFKYVMEREYLRRSNPIESLAKDKDFLSFKNAIKQVIPENDKAEARAYESYLNQKALFNTFNRRALMIVEDYSFTNHFFNVLNDEAYTFLRDKYPVLNQFTEPKIATREKVITINNKNVIKGEVAEGYYQNMLDLANPDVKKVIDPVDNKRLSDLFKMLPLVALYTHGIGYSKEGMNKILPYDDFMEKIFNASKIFAENNLVESTFYNIFNKLVTNNRSTFKDYVTSIEDTSDTESVPEEPPIEVRQTVGGGLEFGDRPKTSAEPATVTVAIMDLSPNAKGLGAGLSTQTVLAKSKGNIVSDYPVTYNGTAYLDADQAFQLNKKGLTENGTGPNSQYSLMVEIMTEKFKQHPKLVDAIQRQGGRSLLINAIHQPTKNNTVWETGGKNYMILALNEAYMSIMEPGVDPASVTNTELSEFVNHSGGAYGGDTFWDMIGREYGVTNHKHYREASNTGLSQKLKNAKVTATILTKAQMDTARAEVQRLLGKTYPDNLQGNLQVRNYFQVANADSVLAVAPITANMLGVTGGTNTAVQLGISLNKPTYVWDTTTEKWYKYNGTTFVETATPVLTKNFAGVGTRNIENYNVLSKTTNKWEPRKEYLGARKEAAAKAAIRQVYERTAEQDVENAPVQLSNGVQIQPIADIPQNKVSGVESFGSTVTANADVIKALGTNPHSIDMIEAGLRTRTTRSESEMAKYAIKVGDRIKHFGKSADGSTKTVYATVTAIHPIGSAEWKGTWTKEGWRAEDVNVIDRFKEGAAAIEFEIENPVKQVAQPTVQPTQSQVPFDKELNEKLKAKLQELYPEIQLKYTNETIDEINDPNVFNQRPSEFDKWKHNDIVREVLGDIRMAQWQKTMALDKNKMAINTTAISLISDEPLKYLSIDRNGFVYLSIEKLSSDIYKELGDTIIPEKTLELVKDFQDSMNSTEGLDIKYNEYVETINKQRASIQERLDKLNDLENLSAKQLYKLLSETSLSEDDYKRYASFNIASKEGRTIGVRFDENSKAILSEVVREKINGYNTTRTTELTPEDDAYLDARISFKTFIESKERLIKGIDKVVKEPLEKALSRNTPISQERFFQNEIEYRYDMTQYSEYEVIAGGLENQLENNLKTNGIINDRGYLTDTFGFTPEGLLKLNKSKEFAELEAKQNKIKYILSNKNKFNKDYDQYEDSFGDGDVLAPMPGWFLNAFSVEVNGKYFDQLVSLAKPFIYQDAQEAYDALNDTGKTPKFQELAEATNLNERLTERINLNPKVDVTNKMHLLNQKDKNRIIGQANIKAMSVLIDAVNQKQDTLPHEYAHHYIAWFRDTPIVQEAIKKWGSEEALVQSIGEQVIKQKGEAYTWWQKFVKWILGKFDKLSTLQKEQLTKILTDAFLTRQDLTAFTQQMTQAPSAPIAQPVPVAAPVQVNTSQEGILAQRNTPLAYTSGQVQALTEIEALIKARQGAYYLLAGYAGTGKTTIAENIARFAQKNGYEVEVIAPTNKAAKVLGTKLTEAQVRSIKPQTIHITIYGEPDPVTKEWTKKLPVSKKVIIVDESSMINEELMKDIVEFTKDRNNIVIFMGDGFQLEQIGTDSGLFSSLKDPSIFTKKYGKSLNGGIMLTEVRRQSLDSEILKIATIARMDNKIYVPEKSTEDFEVVKYPTEFQNQFLQSIKSEEDAVAVVATNDERIRLNNLARRVKFTNPTEPILPGETIVAVANANLYRNSEVFNVASIDNMSEPFPVKFKFQSGDKTVEEKTFNVIMSNVYNNEGKYVTMLMIPELNRPSLYHAQVLEAAKGSPMLMGFLRREGLIFRDTKGKERLEQELVIGTYGYAITGHKSQGSQWDKVYVNQNFTAPSWNPARWYYTAITRAARKVIVLEKSNQTKIVSEAVETKLNAVDTTTKVAAFDYIAASDPDANTLKQFYDTLTLEQNQKLGNLEDLFKEYKETPYSLSIEEFIENIKNCKL